ncbi:YoaK family protein [Mycobacterium sp. 050134]|uniref:YoaK family protein n=1 Tax=Mycobacterium sp. 050134 TaxID=3096111 RepID=UPI002EDA36A0
MTLTSGRFDSEARLSWVLAALAGLIGAAAFTHSAGYFVTFMTGNTERAALGYFRNQPWLVLTASLLLAAFLGGVVVASLCRRHLWVAHPHGPTALTALSLSIATAVCVATHGWSEMGELSFAPIVFVAFGIGALNTSFVKDGEVSTPLSYVTGTLVKMGQGIERHISGGSATAWLGYLLLYISFAGGAIIGGLVSLVANGAQMLAVATVVCSVTAGYTYFHGDRRALLREAKGKQAR